jgi:toxin HigB-1
VGFCAIFKPFFGFEFFLLPNRVHAPPGNRLEKLKGDWAGQYSIRINDQWRICFKWSANKAKDVEIVDYHG